MVEWLADDSLWRKTAGGKHYYSSAANLHIDTSSRPNACFKQQFTYQTSIWEMGFKVENPVLALGWCFNVYYNITIHISTCIAFVEITTQSWNSTTTISVFQDCWSSIQTWCDWQFTLYFTCQQIAPRVIKGFKRQMKKVSKDRWNHSSLNNLNIYKHCA